MKNALKALAVLSIAVAPMTAIAGGSYSTKQVASANAATSQTIVDIAASSSDFSTLVAAVQAAGLADALSGGSLTVFAPTNAAFAKLPAGTVENLLKPENKDQLVSILTYHVVDGAVPSSAAQATQTHLKSLNGQKLKVNGMSSHIKVDGANVVKADIAAANGVIHVIDTVLLPK